MPQPANLVHETTIGTGAGNLTLAAVNGRRRFFDAIGTPTTPNIFDYFISSQSAAEWERGTGHMADANTLVRDTVLQSSNANALVAFAAGIKDVMNDIPALEQMRVAVNLAQAAGGVADTNAALTNLTVFNTQAIGDVDVTIPAITRHVIGSAALTANRVWTLPPSTSSVQGAILKITTAAIASAFTLTLAPSAGNNLVGVGGTVGNIALPGTPAAQSIILVLSGTSWRVVGGSAVVAGGTGASTPAAALTALGGQPLDADLTAIAALATTAYGRGLLTASGAAALAAEVDSYFLTPAEGAALSFQPLDSDLTAIAALATTAFGRALLTLADAAALRTAAALGSASLYTAGNAANNVPILDAAGVIGEYDLPARLAGSAAMSIVSWDAAIENGWYMTAPGAVATNKAPTADTWYLGFVQVHNVQWTTQIVHAFANMTASDSMTWRRRQVGGVWEATWTRLYSSAGDLAPLVGAGNTAVGDVDYAILSTDRNVFQVSNPTANRTYYLPISSTVPLGTKVTVLSFYIASAFTISVVPQSPDALIPAGASTGVGGVPIGTDGLQAVTFLSGNGAWYVIGGTAFGGGGTGSWTKIGAYDLSKGPVTTVPVATIINLDNVPTPTIYLSGTNTNIEQIILGNGKHRYVYVGGPSTGNVLKWLIGVSGGNIITEGSADMVLSGGDSFEVVSVASGQTKIHSWTSLRGQSLNTGGSQVPVKAGFSLTPYTNANLTNGQTFTPNPLLHNYQIIGNNSTSGQNVTIAAPTVDCAIDILWVNGGVVAGSVTFSGFMVPAGEPVPTTAANARFIISIRRLGTVSTFVVKALQ